MIALEPIASADGLNIGRYGRLLAKFAPKVIETEAENEAALAIVESLMKKGDEGRSHEEEAMRKKPFWNCSLASSNSSKKRNTIFRRERLSARWIF